MSANLYFYGDSMLKYYRGVLLCKICINACSDKVEGFWADKEFVEHLESMSDVHAYNFKRYLKMKAGRRDSVPIAWASSQFDNYIERLHDDFEHEKDYKERSNHFYD